MVNYVMSKLTRGEWFIYAWQNGELGDFSTALAEIVKKADYLNKEKLKKAFPEEIKALECYWTIPGWWEEVEEKVLQLKKEEELLNKMTFTIHSIHAIPLKLCLQKLIRNMEPGSTVDLLKSIIDQILDYGRLKNERSGSN